MASSKSLPFLIIAGIILAVAVIWNVFFNEGAAVQTTATKTEIEADKGMVEVTNNKAKIEEVTQSVDTQNERVAVIPDPYAHLQGLPREELTAEAKKIGQSHMKFAMRYKTGDQALKALQSFRELEQYDMAADLVGFMQQAFPETQIPSELLD